eukprot:UN01566
MNNNLYLAVYMYMNIIISILLNILLSIFFCIIIYLFSLFFCWTTTFWFWCNFNFFTLFNVLWWCFC